MSLAIDLSRMLLLGLVVGLAGSVARGGLDSLSARTLTVWVGLFLTLGVFLLVTSPQELRDTGLQLAVVLFLLAAFWVYDDGLGRVSNLEAALWALVVLCLGAMSLFGVSYTLFAVLTVATYVVRTRFVAGGDDPTA